MTDSLRAVLRLAAAELRDAGVPDGMVDARILVAAAADLTREDMLREPDRPLASDARAALRKMIGRRANREPVSRILGYREFRSLSFDLGPETLDPRPDSETLVEAALDRLAEMPGPVRILDIGTGTGCLLLSILNEFPAATGVGTDISPGACRTARHNAQRLHLWQRADFVCCDWTAPLAGRFDLVVSNPPYISTAEIETLSPEVARHDPYAALHGGGDGLEAYRAIAQRLGDVLAPGGRAIFEIGSTQSSEVSSIFTSAGYNLSKSRTDLAGRPRCLEFSPVAGDRALTN